MTVPLVLFSIAAVVLGIMPGRLMDIIANISGMIF